MTNKVEISVDTLSVGMFVDIQLNWTQHPFLFSKLKIKSKSEIALISKLVDTVILYPDKSDIEYQPEQDSANAQAQSTKTRQELWDQKQTLIDNASAFRLSRQKAAKQYREAQKRVRNLTMDLKVSPANAIVEADQVISDMTRNFEQDTNLLINLVNLSNDEYSFHNHSLNVAVLCLILGHELGLQAEELRILGIAAVLHDVGKVSIPAAVLNNPTPNPSELKLIETHVKAGAKLVSVLDAVPNQAIEVILNHHEFLDGTGYPRGVKAEQISQYARIVAIANLYDNLCNPVDPKQSMPPKSAMAILFAKYKDKLDGKLIQHFIQTFGVYPPGTIVELTDSSIGLVVAVNSGSILNPKVVLYNPDIPRNQALMVDLSELPELQIQSVIKPIDCPERVFDYLGMQDKMAYFFD